MKICRLCNLEYSDGTNFCARCSSKLEIGHEKWISPRDYEDTY